MGKSNKTPSRSERCKKYLGGKSKKDGKQKTVARARQAQRNKRKGGANNSGSSSAIDCSKYLGEKDKARSSSQGSGKCHKQGPVTRNPFFNFLRDYRKKHCGKTVVQIARDGAKEWRSMSEQQKEQYIKSACLAPKTKRKARRCSRKGEKGAKRAKRHGSSSQSSCASSCKSLMSRSRSISRTSTGPSTF